MNYIKNQKFTNKYEILANNKLYLSMHFEKDKFKTLSINNYFTNLKLKNFIQSENSYNKDLEINIEKFKAKSRNYGQNNEKNKNEVEITFSNSYKLNENNSFLSSSNPKNNNNFQVIRPSSFVISKKKLSKNNIKFKKVNEEFLYKFDKSRKEKRNYSEIVDSKVTNMKSNDNSIQNSNRISTILKDQISSNKQFLNDIDNKANTFSSNNKIIMNTLNPTSSLSDSNVLNNILKKDNTHISKYENSNFLKNNLNNKDLIKISPNKMNLINRNSKNSLTKSPNNEIKNTSSPNNINNSENITKKGVIIVHRSSLNKINDNLLDKTNLINEENINNNDVEENNKHKSRKISSNSSSKDKKRVDKYGNVIDKLNFKHKISFSDEHNKKLTLTKKVPSYAKITKKLNKKYPNIEDDGFFCNIF